MSKKPIIGITCNYSNSDKQSIKEGIGVAGQKWQLLADDYIESIEKAGGIGLIIPLMKDFKRLKKVINIIDGLLLTGGNDIDPVNYKECATKECKNINPQRDKQDLFLTKYFLSQTNKPFMGICRGIQILNVSFGGTIYQDIDINKFDYHTLTTYPKDEISQEIIVEKNSILYDIFQKKSVGINSFHHQAIKKLASNLRAVAKTKDGLIEAVELKENNNRFVLAVQWHPEMMTNKNKEQQKLITKFVKSCKI